MTLVGNSEGAYSDNGSFAPQGDAKPLVDTSPRTVFVCRFRQDGALGVSAFLPCRVVAHQLHRVPLFVVRLF